MELNAQTPSRPLPYNCCGGFTRLRPTLFLPFAFSIVRLVGKTQTEVYHTFFPSLAVDIRVVFFRKGDSRGRLSLASALVFRRDWLWTTRPSFIYFSFGT